jgi:hypothetical protein
LEEERSVRSNFDSIPRPRDLVEDEEDIHILKTKDKLPPRPPSPGMDSIHVPPIHQDVFTHHRHIDHGENPVPILEKEILTKRFQAMGTLIRQRCPHQKSGLEEAAPMKSTYITGKLTDLI